MSHTFMNTAARMSLVGAALMLIAGCGSPSEPAVQTTSGATSELPQDAGVPGLARAVPQGKPGAAVGLSYDLQGRPEVGQSVPLELVFQPGVQVQALSAVITGMDGLALLGELQAGFEPVRAGEQYRHLITVTPQRAGVCYLTVVITALHEGGDTPQGRTFSIPFSVGDAPVQQKPSPPEDAAGEAIESLPAQE